VHGAVDVCGRLEKFVVRVDPHAAPALGQTVTVAPRESAVYHLFDPTTGERIM
jgi:multiple sugar transport system ATP-binding protein